MIADRNWQATQRFSFDPFLLTYSVNQISEDSIRMESSSSKRQKVSSNDPQSTTATATTVSSSSSSSSSHQPTLFSPFRALGYISNQVPFLLQIHRGGKDAQSIDLNIVTCLGNSWAMWEGKKLGLLFVGE